MTEAFVPLAIGAALALLIGFFAGLIGFDRERSFFPTLLIVIAGYYVLFAAIGGSKSAMPLELSGFLVFSAVAVLGYQRHTRFIVAAVCAHGVFDMVHERLVANPGVPAWWPAFCAGFDVSLGVWIAWRATTSRSVTARLGSD